MFSTSLVFCSEAPLAAPHIQGTEKIYAPKIQKLVDEIGTLTLLEVADLNELLKVNFFSLDITKIFSVSFITS